MFNLGFTHIILLGVIALIVVGPEQLPDLAKKLAHMLNDLRRAKDEILGPVTQMHNDTQKMIDEAKSKATQDIQQLLDLRHKLDEQIRAQQTATPPGNVSSGGTVPAASPATTGSPEVATNIKKDPDGQPG